MPYEDPGTPPLTTAPAYLWWVARGQAGLVVAAGTLGVVGAISQAALPFLLGRVVDGGLDNGLSRELWAGALSLLAVGLVALVANVVGHWADVHNWIRASFRTSQLVGHHVSRTGDAVTAELPTGEVVATVASDSLRVGEVFYVSARFIGGMVAYGVVAVVLLTTSVPLGLAVLLGIPAVAGVLALIVRPLQRRQAAQREQSGRLTTLGADTVSGLRILRGIGGEDVFAARYREQSQRVRAAGVRVAQTQSLLDAMQALLPGLFLAGVVWYGARLALAGQITPGQLVAFYGYAAFLTQPLQAATEAVHVVSRALVGVRKILAVLRVPVTGAENARVTTAQRGTGPAADLTDARSGLHVPAGSTVALVSADPDDSARVALRLGLLGSHDDDDASSVRLGGVPLSSLGLAEVRRRIVVGESTPALFSGLLRDELDVRGRATVQDVLGAVLTADAADVLDSVPDGLDGRVEEKGRSLSGGQRQRLALARALLTEPEVLVLVEPTSAVDAHTEARIASRLADARRGRTTVLVTASPLVLDRVDRVLLVQDGRVVDEGTHRELLDGGPGRAPSAAYRRVVSRAAADPTTGETPVVPAALVPAPRHEPTAPRKEEDHAAARR